MGLDGSAAKRVAQATATSVATVSPDGGEIYFDANLGNGDTIYRVSSRGGPARPVSPLHATAPCASPDGKSLGAIVSTAGKPPHLGVIDVTSGALLREFDSAIPSSFTRCRWSPDGATIFYNVGSFLYAAPAAGGAPRVIQHYDSPTVIDRFDVAHDGTLAVVSGLLTRDAYLITGFE
jgi:WD40 repeat protein